MLSTYGFLIFLSAATPLAPELEGLGSLSMPVSTANPRAQRFFDQGLRLLYAFNHPEALRAFREAARLDPGLGMAYWGQAMAVSPNLNAPLTPENRRIAIKAIKQARINASRAGTRDRALIDALAKRFIGDAKAERATLDRAYADAMRHVAGLYPGDPDVQTLYADAVMNTMPWDYWKKDGSPKPETATVIATLDAVIAAHPDHPGAHHYYIHVLEASDNPARAERSADRLGSLMPAAGHLVHMPAHIYIRTGRYADAAEANVRALAADEDYLAQCQAQGLYPVSYYPHNLHFLWAAATLEGRSEVAIDAARRVAEKVPHHHAGAVAWTADFPVTPWLAYVRFGRWKEMLTEPAPPANEPYATGIWHYARALAYVARDQAARADAESAALAAAIAHPAFQTTLKSSPLLTNLQIAARIVKGEMAAKAGRSDEAIASLGEAVALEDGIPYNEPPVWHHPARQILGAVLLDAGKSGDAEKVYLEDLRRFPENGWSLFGLSRSLDAQGRSDEARSVRARFEKAWARADITLNSSRVLSSVEPAIKTTSMKEVPVRSVVLADRGVTLQYVEQGDPFGVPVILLHGVTDSWRSFEPLLPYLPSSFRAFAISQRGHGDSSRPAEGYRYVDFSEDVRAFMDVLRLPAAVVVGHSMGGLVAERFAIDHPERTLGLVVMGSFKTIRGNHDVRELWSSTISRMDGSVSPAFVRSFQESTLARPVPSDYFEAVVAESLKVPARVWRATFAEFLLQDHSDALGRVTAPTLILWGEKDAFSGRAEQDSLVASIPGARLVTYADGGHALHWEDPRRVGAEISGFARQLQRASEPAALVGGAALRTTVVHGNAS